MGDRQINELIQDHELLVIDENGRKLGKMTKQEAILKAKEAQLDLVLFVPKEKTGSLSIAKIVDASKFKYEESIKEKQHKKKISIVLSKEVKIKPQIGNHDLQWKANQARNWLNKNIQIKLKIEAWGRVGFKPELIEEVYNKFINLVSDCAKIIIPLKKITPTIYTATLVKK